jgi:hypothetical protein
MEALNVQIVNPKAKALLLNLEEMNLIRIKLKSKRTERIGLLEDLKDAAREVRLHKEGKLKLKTAQDLLNEL